jgi:hypothetical protein
MQSYLLLFVAVVARGPKGQEGIDYRALCDDVKHIQALHNHAEHFRAERKLDAARGWENLAYEHIDSAYRPRLAKYCKNYPRAPLTKFLRFIAWVDEFRPYSSR